MAYAIYRNGRKIIRISGNPRSRVNQRGLVVWAPTQSGVKSWVRKWGTTSQKRKFT